MKSSRKELIEILESQIKSQIQLIEDLPNDWKERGRKTLDDMLDTLEELKDESTPARKKAAATATAARTKKASEKIENAIRLLKMTGEEITAYRVAKESGVSYNTARKHLKEKGFSNRS